MSLKKTLRLIIRILIITPCFLLINKKNKVHAVPIGPTEYFINIENKDPIQKNLKIYTRPTQEPGTVVYIRPVGMKKVGEKNERHFYIPDIYDMTEPANWIYIPENQREIELIPGKTSIIEWELKPNKYMGCGTNIAAIMISDKPLFEQENTNQINLNKQIAIQIHANVLNKINTEDCPENKVDLELKEFTVKNPNNKLLTLKKIEFTTRIENKGNLLANTPQGFITVTGVGDKLTIPFNTTADGDGLNIYPNTTQNFNNKWIDNQYPEKKGFFQKLIYEISNLRIGKYEAKLGVTKNAQPHIIATRTFWIIPWRVIIATVGLIVILYLPIIITTKLKKKK